MTYSNTPQSFGIRAAIPSDVRAIAHLINLTFNPYIDQIGRVPSALLVNYQEVIERDRVWVMDLSQPNRSSCPVDFLIAVLVLVLEEYHNHYHVNTLAVHPQHQRQGIGTALLRHAEVEAIAAGHREIWLHTNETMTHNIKLYTSIGYEERYRKIKPNTNSIYMRKRL